MIQAWNAYSEEIDEVFLGPFQWVQFTYIGSITACDPDDKLVVLDILGEYLIIDGKQYSDFSIYQSKETFHA